jgi:hypothetical protein
MKYNLLFILVLSIALVGLTSATTDNLGIFKAGDCVNLLQTCADCTYNSITSVVYPNSSIALGLTNMEKNGLVYNYSFCDTSQVGEYIVNGFGDLGGTDTIWNYKFEVTTNGKQLPEGIVVVLFSIAFLIIMGFLVFELIISIGHFASLDLDVVDLSKCIGIYFALFALYELGLFYLGNPELNSWLLLFIKIGAFTHIIIPITGFLISITVGSLKKKTVEFGTQRIYRRHQI